MSLPLNPLETLLRNDRVKTRLSTLPNAYSGRSLEIGGQPLQSQTIAKDYLLYMSLQQLINPIHDAEVSLDYAGTHTTFMPGELLASVKRELLGKERAFKLTKAQTLLATKALLNLDGLAVPPFKAQPDTVVHASELEKLADWLATTILAVIVMDQEVIFDGGPKVLSAYSIQQNPDLYRHLVRESVDAFNAFKSFLNQPS